MKTLLHKYVEGSISASEIDELSSIMDNTSDSALEDLIAEDWMAFESDNQLQESHKSKLLWETSPWPGRIAWLSGAAALVAIVALLITSLKLHSANQTMMSIAGEEIRVEAGCDGSTSVTLPDGSTVLLNAKSILTYPSDFGISQRETNLTGEGWFEVTKVENKTFTVKTKSMDISVLGTKFNVYAYPDNDREEVSLVEGSLSVSCGDVQYRVAPNEKAIVDKSSSRLNVFRTDNEIETAWLKKDLVFMHEPLYRVIDILQRRFGVQIHCSESIDLTDRYTGTFRDRRIADILDILQIHYGFTYSVDGNNINITKQ